jgi:uncharacterized protein
VVDSHGGFAWYELITTDMEAAKAFYTKVMGWGAWDASVPGTTYTLFIAGKASVGGLMELPEEARKMGGTPGWIGYVWVNDVDAAADRVARLGGTVHVSPTDVPAISRFSVFADPQLARLALFRWLKPGQGPPPEPGAPGHVGWHELLAVDCEKALAFYGELFGWQKADSEVAELGPYQLFSVGGQIIGGMVAKPPTMPDSCWLYYFNVGDIDTAAQRVKAESGQILEGPVEVAGGSWVVVCTDPQGAMFALEGKRNAIGYFALGGSRHTSETRGR